MSDARDMLAVTGTRAVHRAFGSKRGGSHWKRMNENEGGANLPSFLYAKNYKPYIFIELEAALRKPVLYRTNPGATPATCHARLDGGGYEEDWRSK